MIGFIVGTMLGSVLGFIIGAVVSVGSEEDDLYFDEEDGLNA